jgi:TonB family protein
MRGPILIVLVFCGGACSGRSGSAFAEHPPTRSPADHAAGRHCTTLKRPPAPISLDEVTRPGTRGAVATWGHGAAMDSVEISVRYGREGQLDWVRTTRGNVSADRAAELERIVRGGVYDAGPADWGFRVRLVGGHVQAVLPSVVCPPVRTLMVGRRPPPAGTDVDMAEMRQARGRRIELEVSLNEAGDVVDIRVTRTSGSRFVDLEAMDRALWIRYLPMLHDDKGVPSVLPLTFTVQFVRRRAPRGWTAVPEVVG